MRAGHTLPGRLAARRGHRSNRRGGPDRCPRDPQQVSARPVAAVLRRRRHLSRRGVCWVGAIEAAADCAARCLCAASVRDGNRAGGVILCDAGAGDVGAAQRRGFLGADGRAASGRLSPAGGDAQGHGSAGARVALLVGALRVGSGPGRRGAAGGGRPVRTHAGAGIRHPGVSPRRPCGALRRGEGTVPVA